MTRDEILDYALEKASELDENEMRRVALSQDAKYVFEEEIEGYSVNVEPIIENHSTEKIVLFASVSKGFFSHIFPRSKHLTI